MRSVPEWVAKHDDQSIPSAVKDRVWQRAANKCQCCFRTVRPGDKGELDHIKPLINGGRHVENNLQLLCGWCHAEKTKLEAAARKITNRIRKKHNGIKKPSTWPNRDGKYDYNWQKRRYEKIAP